MGELTPGERSRWDSPSHSVALDGVQVGRAVRIGASGRRGVVLEVDERLHVARVEFGNGTERWCLVEDLDPVGDGRSRRSRW